MTHALMDGKIKASKTAMKHSPRSDIWCGVFPLFLTFILAGIIIPATFTTRFPTTATSLTFEVTTPLPENESPKTVAPS